MITIGTFTRNGNQFTGIIETLSVLREVWLLPSTPEADNPPHYRLHLAERPAPIGHGWSKRDDDGKRYVHVVISDPALLAPINCRLVKAESGYELLWDERRPVSDDSLLAAMLDALYDAEIQISEMLEDYADEPGQDIRAHRTLSRIRVAIAATENSAASLSS